MKRLSTIMVCLFAMMAASLSAKAQEITITLYPGWNWISYPKAEAMDIATALGDFVPVNGDILKSQFSGSTYNNGYWRGGVTHFMPGWGYHYYSNRTEIVSFVFGETAPKLTVTTAEPTEITATSANSGGSIISNDGSYIYVLQKGICWATHPNPMVMNDFFTENGSGAESYTAEMSDLSPNTVYYVRAFAVTLDGTFYGDEVSFTTLSIPEGAINGLFSVSETQQVYFSQGNLQYQASTNTWRFAYNQWDYLGSLNSNISQTNSGWIDLFAWGTSGYNHGAVCYQPWSISDSYYNYYAYGSSTYNLFDQTGHADWGYNPISNGGNQENQWRTLTNDEWIYVLNTRSTASGIRYAKANVKNVNGVILLPDDWNTSTYSLNNTNNDEANYTSNTLTVSQWSVLEQVGAVFLPSSGFRTGTSFYISDPGTFANQGPYWSSSFSNGLYAYGIVFYDTGLIAQYNHGRHNGLSVRLVQDYNR